MATVQLNSSGVAVFSTTTLTVGTHTITASYSGDTKDVSSVSPAVNFVAAQSLLATTTTLSASATQINTGQSVAFTAKVVPQSGKVVPTGSIKFFDGTTTLGKASLNAGGTATLSTTSLAAGTHSITASYFGDNEDSSSVSTAVSVMVTQSTVATTTTLTASAAQITSGQSVTFTATVAPQSGSNVATGTVTFLDGTTTLGTGTLNASGVATFTTTALAVGTQSIEASYAGDSKDNSSVSQAVSVVVSQSMVSIATTTTLSASATQITTGQSVTFTASVSPQAGSNVATGTVTFLDGTTTLGTSALNGSATSAFTTTTLTAGTHSIVASYGGDSKDGSSVSSAVSVTVTVAVSAPQGSIATSTTLSASSTEVLPSQNVTFTAVVAPQSGSNVPTGTVTFLDGAKSLGNTQLSASGGATLNLASLSIGTHSITASYGGDANDSPSMSAVLTINVSAPEYAMVVSATSVNLTPGQPSNLTVTLIPENGFNQPIDLTCSGLPQGTTCTFNPATVTPNGAPVMSTVTMMAPQLALAPSQAPHRVPGGILAFGWVMPWGFISLLGLARTRKRSQIAQWSFRLVVAAAFIAGSLWVSGCGYSANSNGAGFTVTLTASASNAQTHTSQIAVHVQQ
jgi:hypothetical protein